MDQRSFTTVFIPGNHDNYDRLMSDEFPVRVWNKGLVKEIRPSVLMLLRGEVYEIEGKKLFSFGGGKSHDISDGILDSEDPEWRNKEKLLKRSGKRLYRVKGISWWENELPLQSEMDHGLEKLEQYQWKVDYVITHCAPSAVQRMMGINREDVLTDYLDQIRDRLDYGKWFFGHYHACRHITEKDILVYEQIMPI